MDELTASITSHLEGKKLIIVFNKIDLVDDETRNSLTQYYSHLEGEQIFISAKNQINTNQLESLLLKVAQIPEVGENDVMVTNMRHYEALSHAYESIERVQDGLEKNISGDFLSQDIRECLYYLGEITGEITTDEVLGTIFSRFCIGK